MVKEGYLVAGQAHVYGYGGESCLNSRAWQVKDGALSQRKATDNKRSRRVATTVFIHSAPLPQHEPPLTI